MASVPGVKQEFQVAVRADLVPDRIKAWSVYRAARRVYRFRDSQPFKRFRQKHLRNDRRLIEDYLAREPAAKLHLGCGDNILKGWLNTDYYPASADIPHIDATVRFPLPDDRFELVFSEHMIEHLTPAGAINMLKESLRVLRPGGRIRVSTPDLEALVAIYQKPEQPLHRQYLKWHAETWLQDQPLTTPAAVLNDFYRNWGHLLILDEDTLRRALEMAGFADIVRCELNVSADPGLRNLEHEGRMPAGLLKLHTMTLEAVKPASA